MGRLNLAAISVRTPRPGTPKDSREWEDYWNDLLERTGGETDKVEETAVIAETVQGVADTALANAAAAQAAADAAQIAADDAQTDATAALAAASAAQADANEVWVQGEIPDFASSTANGRFTLASPVAGTITSIVVALNSGTFGGAFTITPTINGTNITSGAITVADLTAGGTTATATPTAANVVAVGDVVKVQSGGSASTAGRANVLFRITRT
jgi:biotin carboxyl carrier protein